MVKKRHMVINKVGETIVEMDQVLVEANLVQVPLSYQIPQIVAVPLPARILFQEILKIKKIKIKNNYRKLVFTTLRVKPKSKLFSSRS
ncbi:hypothetical protein BpHYR1_014925 [Brachionus plicatilis]|uniref:Uncharacterized protein n=1 Tax=Brachionus plicatilis TaxID=10195 RepID=A0A3M7RF67_BRAPC|nr:hypothetical protein BpHYR1_014925 [Brachionus plicatilis]